MQETSMEALYMKSTYTQVYMTNYILSFYWEKVKANL